MPIYKEGPDAWRVRIWFQGQKHDRKVRGSKAEAKAAEMLLFGEVQAGKLAPKEPEKPKVPSLGAFVDDHYEPWLKLNTAKGTWSTKKGKLKILSGYFDPKRIDQITLADVEAYKAHRIEEGKQPSTVNLELRVLKAALRKAREFEFPAKVPKFAFLQERERLAKAWTKKEVAALYKAIKTTFPPLLPVVTFLLNSGCRRMEAITLRTRSVDLRKGVVWIEPSKVWKPKTGKPRMVPISPIIRPHLEEAVKAGREFVFVHTKGKPWKTWPDREFDAARDAAGLKGGVHRTRHTYASFFLASGNPKATLVTLARILGHSATTTTELYSHMLPGQLEGLGDVVTFDPETLEEEIAAKKAAKEAAKLEAAAQAEGKVKAPTDAPEKKAAKKGKPKGKAA